MIAVPASPTSIRLAIVDDYPLYRDGIACTMSHCREIEIVGMGATADDAIRIAVETEPDILLFDMSPPDGMEAIQSISALQKPPRLLILSALSDDGLVCRAMRLGAHGYMLKASNGSELRQAIHVVKSGGRYISPSLAVRLLKQSDEGRRLQAGRDRFDHLTPREQQILSILVEGTSNKEIGNRLELSEKTIKHHLTSILSKLSVRNRVEAALLASRMSWTARIPAE